MTSNTPESHPPVDWTQWTPPGVGDVRSPCPVMNALANHDIIPHNGKGISKDLAIKALGDSINMDSSLANLFATISLRANPDPSMGTFDLDQVSKHGFIEHDVSISRNDANLGDNTSFDDYVFDQYKQICGDAKETSFELQSKARFARVLRCKEAHEAAKTDFQYGIKELILSYGESALILASFGDPVNGKIPLEWVKVLVEQERLPYKEGWRRSEKPITQSDINHVMLGLFHANEHKFREAEYVGLGTMHAVTTAISNSFQNYCPIM